VFIVGVNIRKVVYNHWKPDENDVPFHTSHHIGSSYVWCELPRYLSTIGKPCRIRVVADEVKKVEWRGIALSRDHLYYFVRLGLLL
jgi:hypothetical protein